MGGGISGYTGGKAMDQQFAEEFVARFFPDVDLPEVWEQRYQPRTLPPGAAVTRYAPSPTGFQHIGGIYIAIIAKDIARQSGGVFFVRVEDTDKAREVPGAREQFDRVFQYFGIESEEGDPTGAYGPYQQSCREPIYHSYVRELLLKGLAYPCFCTREDLAQQAALQEAQKATPGYYGEWARCRNLSDATVREHLERNLPFAIRFRAPDSPEPRVLFHDLIRGPVELANNRIDIVLLKSPEQGLRLPTYHLAHVIDDHLMRVTVVIRGEEWISSVPVHLQLFDALGFASVPYAHIAPLMKIQGTSKRKLSKRKDPESNVDFYIAAGIPAVAVRHYLRGLANSRLADMPVAEAARMPLEFSLCGVAGPMFDLVKLESVSREWIAQLNIDEIIASVESWAREHDLELANLVAANRDLTRRILRLERELVERPRKELAKWSDFRRAYSFFFPALFELVTNAADERFSGMNPDLVRRMAADFVANYQHSANKEEWFHQIRELSDKYGFAPTNGELKRNPQQYVGSIRDVSNVFRVAITGQTQSTELFLVAQVLGAAEVKRRVACLAGGGVSVPRVTE